MTSPELGTQTNAFKGWLGAVSRIAAGIIGFAFAGSLGVAVSLYIYDRDIFDAALAQPLSKWVTNCDSLGVELQADAKYCFDDNCTMTRDEYSTFEERRDKYQRLCMSE